MLVVASKCSSVGRADSTAAVSKLSLYGIVYGQLHLADGAVMALKHCAAAAACWSVATMGKVSDTHKHQFSLA
jgi:hypothetical protein